MVDEKKSKMNYIRRVFVYLIALNFFLFLIKYLPVIFFNSVTVEAEAYHSLADVMYTLILLFGVYFAFLPRDKSHPHGHERMRPFLSLVVAASVFYTGLIIIEKVIGNLIYGSSWSFTPIFLLVLFTSGIAKYFASRYLEIRSKYHDSDIIKSISKDYKADAIANISAILGVSGAFLGFTIFDSVFGLFVSIWIFKTAYDIGKKNFGFLTGAAPGEEIRDEIEERIKKGKVNEILEIEAHYVGPKLHVYCVVTLPETLNIKKAHKKEEEIKSSLEEIKEVDTAYIHIEPEEANSQNNNKYK